MKHDYGDIRSSLGRPAWWDEVGCPRYAAFAPAMACDFYAMEAALVRIRCQNCHVQYQFCISAGEMDKRPLQVRPPPRAYGDSQGLLPNGSIDDFRNDRSHPGEPG